jgi:hypothetical protein
MQPVSTLGIALLSTGFVYSMIVSWLALSSDRQAMDALPAAMDRRKQWRNTPPANAWHGGIHAAIRCNDAIFL